MAGGADNTVWNGLENKEQACFHLLYTETIHVLLASEGEWQGNLQTALKYKIMCKLRVSD